MPLYQNAATEKGGKPQKDVMMKVNTHYQAIDSQTVEAIVKLLGTMQEVITPRVTPLTARDRRYLPKMGEKTLAFVEKCHEFARNNPGLCPKYLDMEAFSTDYEGAFGLFNAVNMAAQLRQNLADTQMCAGSEAYQSALVFYRAVKEAASNNVPGAKAVYEELSKRFPAKRSRYSHRVLSENTLPQEEE